MEHLGRQTWCFNEDVYLNAAAAVSGPKEALGPLGASFDYSYAQLNLGQKSFEKAEQQMQQKAVEIALKKAQLKADDIDIYLAGDLLNQIISSGFTARNLALPFLGLFSACATSTAGLALAALLVAAKVADFALTATGSHNLTAERQFRYPNEYGCQKPQISQYTCTAAGAGIISLRPSAIKIKAATIGKVQDLGVSDPFQMGAAMAPAFADTILTHLRESGQNPHDYDYIISGDLGRVGAAIGQELLLRGGLDYPPERLLDCGSLLYHDDDKEVMSGGSGAGCSASVLYGHFYQGLLKGDWQRILFAATGALLSPLSCQQKESIPAICHAVVLERG